MEDSVLSLEVEDLEEGKRYATTQYRWFFTLIISLFAYSY